MNTKDDFPENNDKWIVQMSLFNDLISKTN